MHLAEANAQHGKRSLDAGVNIVPYIDMLMTLMVFLMISAVWTHDAVLPADSANGGASSTTTAPADAPISVHVGADGLRVGDAGFALDDVAGAVSAARAAHVSEQALDITVDDGIPFARVASFMDAARGAGLRAQALHGVVR
ncbi:MAG TPA: biopolymer transporter ExbD [Myxococcota bacterium]|jgi:biopolymer transport protein ExbD